MRDNTHAHLPVKERDATAHLADVSSWPIAGSMTDDVVAILRTIMRVGELTQYDLAEKLKMTQPSISRLLGGAEPKFRTRQRILSLARRLGVIKSSQGSLEASSVGVLIVAEIAQAGELRLLKQSEQGIAPLPPGPISSTVVAATVVGNGMSPMMDDGWIVYWDPAATEDEDEMLGKLCVVKLAGSQYLVRRVFSRRRPGLFDLHAVNAAPLLRQHIEAAHRVLWILPQ